jgi:hypothetical protein
MAYGMAWESWSTNQAVVMKAPGFKISGAAQATKSMRTGTATRGAITTGGITGKGFTGGPLMSPMLGTSLTASDKARASGKRVGKPMLASGTNLGDTASASWSVLTATGMKASGRTTASMAKAETLSPMGMHSSGGTKTASIMETVSTAGLMEDSTKALSRMARNQGRASGSNRGPILYQTLMREIT